MKEYQERHQYIFSFGTEASLNLAQDKELLKLFREANFSWVFIGIESPDPASLKETLKTQNLHEDILTSVRRIYENGIDVLAGFIIGFDNDTLATFELQYQFITDAGIQSAMIGLLTALPKTPLYERIEKEGRLIPDAGLNENTRAATNIVPKNMSYDAMVAAYQNLYRRLLSDREIALRIRNKVRYLRAPIYTSGYSTRRASRHPVAADDEGGAARRAYPGCGISCAPCRGWRRRISRWSSPTGSSACPCASMPSSTCSAQRDTDGSLERRVGAVRRALASYLEAGKVTLSLRQTRRAGPRDLRQGSARPARSSHAPRRICSGCCATRAPALPCGSRPSSHRSFRRCRACCAVWPAMATACRSSMDERLRALVPIDSSVFNLVLARQAD